MSRRDTLSLAPLLILLASCVGSGPPPGSAQAQANAQTVAACRQRADAVYNMRHRDTIYAPPSDVNAPFSGNYAPGEEDRNLSRIFERDSMMTDCVRNTGAEGDRSPQPGGPSSGVGPAPPGIGPAPLARP